MNLDDLDREIEAKKQEDLKRGERAPMMGAGFYDAVRNQREERLKENKAILNGVCPTCGHSLTCEKSKYNNDLFYYQCTNPALRVGHLFVR